MKLEESDIMKRKREFLIFLGLLISLFSICTGYQASDQCTWDQHLRIPGRTGYSPCDGPETSEVLWEIPNQGDINIPPLVIGGDTIVVLVKDLPGFTGPNQSYSSLLEIDLMTGKVKTIFRETGEYYDFFYDGSYYYIVDERDYEENERKILRFDPDEESLVPVASISGICKSSPHCHAITLEDVILYPTTPLFCFSRPEFEVLWSTESILPNSKITTIENVVANDSNVFISVKERIKKEEEVEYTYHLYNLDIKTSEIIWQKSMGGYLALEEDTLFVGDGRIFYALDAATGQILWRNREEAISSFNIVVGPEYIFAACYKDEGSESSYQHTVIALDKKTGEVVWKRELGFTALTIFLVGGGQYLYCATSFIDIQTYMVCFYTKTGEKVWELTFEDETYPREVRTFPALANGILVVPTYWGPIYAFGSEITEEPEVTPPPPKTESPVHTQSPAPSETAPPETTPPDIAPPRTEPSQSPPPGPEPLHVPEYLIVVAGIIGGILILMLYMWQKHK
jgi:outer membrane protein assembly factor BamB